MSFKLSCVCQRYKKQMTHHITLHLRFLVYKYGSLTNCCKPVWSILRGWSITNHEIKIMLHREILNPNRHREQIQIWFLKTIHTPQLRTQWTHKQTHSPTKLTWYNLLAILGDWNVDIVFFIQTNNISQTKTNLEANTHI